MYRTLIIEKKSSYLFGGLLSLNEYKIYCMINENDDYKIRMVNEILDYNELKNYILGTEHIENCDVNEIS